MLPPATPLPAAKTKTARKTSGRFAEINGFVDCTLARLTPSAAAVLLILWRDTKPHGLACTGQRDLARRAGVTERAVRKALVELIAAKLVKAAVRRGRAGVGPSAYRVRGVNPDSTE